MQSEGKKHRDAETTTSTTSIPPTGNTLTKDEEIKFNEYIFTLVDDRQRLVLQHANFAQLVAIDFQRILDKYGLTNFLMEAAATQRKALIMDVGCGEGLYLFDFAALLEQRGLLKAAEMFGFDRDQRVIYTAEEFSRAAEVSRPYLKFYTHDLNLPLETNSVLRAEGKTRNFSFIYANFVIEHLPNPRQVVENLYARLAPGGVLYLLDYVYREVTQAGEVGWLAPHPVMGEIYRRSRHLVLSNSDGAFPAEEQAGWLNELGAERVVSEPRVILANGQSEQTLNVLRNFLHITLNLGAILVAKGLLTQQELVEARQKLTHELSATSSGFLTAIATFARKPKS